MKTSPSQILRTLPLALAVLFALSACGSMSTIEGRSKEKSAAFVAAAPWQQKLMREGWIDVGFTPDMVYISLDNPDKKATAENGAAEIWIYNNFDTPTRAFGGGVKVSVQAGSAVPGQGMSPSSPNASKSYISGSVSPDLGAAPVVDPISKLYVLFRQGKVATVEMKKE